MTRRLLSSASVLVTLSLLLVLLTAKLEPSVAGAGSGRSVPTQAMAQRWWGIQVYDSLGVHMLEEAGAGWVRVPLLWFVIEPANTTPENFQWSAQFDQELEELQARNIQPVLTLMGNPAWAATYAGGPIDKVDIGELVQFLEAAVVRYSGPPYNVKYWEMYNEPDNYSLYRAIDGGWGYFGDQPAKYVELLSTVYAPIKTVDPEAKIVLGGLAYDYWESGFSATFVDDILSLGAGPYFDVMNFHYYPYYRDVWEPYGTDIIGKATYLRDKLVAHGVIKPLICTETCMGNAMEGESHELQSRYVVQVFSRSREADLGLTIWWAHVDYVSPMKCGLLNDDGSPRPAFLAYQILSQQLTGTGYVRAWRPGEAGSVQVEAYEFSSTGTAERVVVAWTTDDARHSIGLWAEQLLVVDKYGAESVVDDGDDGDVDGLVHVEVNPSPVYLRSDAKHRVFLPQLSRWRQP